MLRCQLSWYTATPACLLPRAPLRLALASILGLPVFLPGQRCHYTPVTTGRRCHQQLGTHSEHVFACAQAPGMRRHNRIRDAWLHLCRAAGWLAQPEQLVFTGPDVCKRADLVAFTPEGTKIACDVLVTASRLRRQSAMDPTWRKWPPRRRDNITRCHGASVMRMPLLLPSSMMHNIIGFTLTPFACCIGSSWQLPGALPRRPRRPGDLTSPESPCNMQAPCCTLPVCRPGRCMRRADASCEGRPSRSS